MARHRVLGLAAALTLAASAPACRAVDADGAALAAEVRRLIGDARCTADDQCRTLAFGAKACGGPQSYIAWSTLATDPVALQAAGERYAAWRREDLKRSGLMSDCALVADPGAACVAAAAASAPGQGACRLLTGRSGRGREAR